MSDDLREYLEDVRENWDDPYWRADHPEVVAALITLVTGAIGLIFTLLDLIVRSSFA